MYKPRDNKTPPLFAENFEISGRLNPHNRWLTLGALVDWDGIESVCMRYFSRMGRPAKDARLVCGLLIVKWLEGFSDERAVLELRENPYIQAFCGFPVFAAEDAIADAGLLSRARRKMGHSDFVAFEGEVMELLRKNDSLRHKFPRSPAAKKDSGLLGSAGAFLEKLGRKMFRGD
jgi:hypothetical protein